MYRYGEEPPQWYNPLPAELFSWIPYPAPEFVNDTGNHFGTLSLKSKTRTIGFFLLFFSVVLLCIYFTIPVWFKVVAVSQITGKKGTLKRKRQIRELVEHHDLGGEDDFFDSTPARKTKKTKVIFKYEVKYMNFFLLHKYEVNVANYPFIYQIRCPFSDHSSKSCWTRSISELLICHLWRDFFTRAPKNTTKGNIKGPCSDVQKDY